MIKAQSIATTTAKTAMITMNEFKDLEFVEELLFLFSSFNRSSLPDAEGIVTDVDLESVEEILFLFPSFSWSSLPDAEGVIIIVVIVNGSNLDDSFSVVSVM